MASAVNGRTETFIETNFRSDQGICSICKKVNPPDSQGITTSYVHNGHLVHTQCEEQRFGIGVTCHSCECKITQIKHLDGVITKVYQDDLLRPINRIVNKISALLRAHPLLYIPAIILGLPAVILAVIALCLFVLIYGIIATGLVIYDSIVDCAKNDKSEERPGHVAS